MKNFTEIITNGCSLTFGAEILGNMNYKLENKKYAWPVHLAKMINCNYKNLAVCASSNVSIYRSTMDLLLNENLKNKLLIIGWTSLYRTEIIVNENIKKEINSLNVDYESFVRENKYVNITNGFKFKSVKNDGFFWSYQSEKQYQSSLLKNYILSISAICKIYNIDCLMFNALEVLDFDIPENLNCYYNPRNFVFYNKNNKISPHPSLEEHLNFSKLLFEILNQRFPA